MVIGGHMPTEHDILAAQFGPNPYDPRNSAEARNLVTWFARLDVGLSDPTPYWKACRVPSPYPKHWCGAFALTMLLRAALCDWPWIIGDGFVYRLPIVETGLAGDIAIFNTNWHHAVCVGDGRLVNGNGAGGEVTVSWVRPGHQPDSYRSIGPLVERYDQ